MSPASARRCSCGKAVIPDGAAAWLSPDGHKHAATGCEALPLATENEASVRELLEDLETKYSADISARDLTILNLRARVAQLETARERRTPGQAAFEEAVRQRAFLGAEEANPWSGIAPDTQARWEAIARAVIEEQARWLRLHTDRVPA